MNRKRITVVVVYLCLVTIASVSVDENLRVLPETLDGVAANKIMGHYLREQAALQFENWKREYEKRKTAEQVSEYQKRLRAKFIDVLGGFPDRTPLNPQVIGVVRRDGYHMEKIIFESQPKHYVTAALFLPDAQKHKAPYPGVLVPCGHARNAKAYDSYQRMGALLAINGMAALVFDPIDQGERGQLIEDWPKLWGTKAHTMVAVGSILLGRNTATFEVWDGMRGIDYLQSRPEVDPKRIGCTGNSGGGTQTSYLMALDERIIAASPSCYITNFDRLLNTLGGQDAEQNIYAQLAFGMDHADYLMMRAPTPIFICAATKDFFDIGGTWSSFRYAKRLYTRMGFAERVDLLENDAKHNYNQQAREGVVRWMSRWLLGKDKPITEPEIKPLSEEQMQCTPDGQVMLIKGARSVYDLNREYEKDLAKRRKRLWASTERSKLLSQVRKVAGIRRLSELPEPKVEKLGVIEREGYRIEKMIIKPEEGIYLSALMFIPSKKPTKGAVLYLHEEGKAKDVAPGGHIEKLVKAGRLVMAVDLRGVGETHGIGQRYFMPYFGTDGQDFYIAYVLGRSYVGMRAEDVLIFACLLQQKQPGPISLVAIGHVGIPALHAAALEPDLFDSVKLICSLASWSNVVEMGKSQDQLINTVHGALTVYDLPNLAETLGDKLIVEEPLDALGKPIKVK
ncbi:MAG: alpha/beta hydrolase family protein [Planctomycetota bacterium]|jgi:dienelactone hydrolase